MLKLMYKKIFINLRSNISMSYHFYNVFLCSTVSDIEDEEGNAVLEEQEALKLQKQMAEQLDDQDFGLEMFQVGRLQ